MEYGDRRLLRTQPQGCFIRPIRDAIHGKQVEGVLSLQKEVAQVDQVEVTPLPPFCGSSAVVRVLVAVILVVMVVVIILVVVFVVFLM